MPPYKPYQRNKPTNTGGLMPDDTPDLAAITEKTLAASITKLGLDGDVFGTRSRTGLHDFRGDISEVLDAPRTYIANVAEITRDADLRPEAGNRRLLHEAAAAAKERAGVAIRNAQRHLAEIEAGVIDDAQPQFNPAREALARQELTTALGTMTGGDAANAARRVALDGSREAAAVLGSPFGRTVLVARDVENVDAVFADIRAISASVASQRGETDRERVAGAAAGHVRAALGAAIGAAGSYVTSVLGDA